jgi:nicotinamidase-related amidase
MSGPTRSYEPLTSENAALVLVDPQVGLMTGVCDYSTGELKHNVVALAKAAKALKLPIILTTTARDSMWGPTFPELVEALPGVPIIDRSSVNAFDDPNVAQAIAATGREKLIFAARVIRDDHAGLQHAQKTDLSFGLAERSGGVEALANGGDGGERHADFEGDA